MPESINFGLTTPFVKQEFKILLKKHGSLAKAITNLLNRDKLLVSKYRFRSLANCEVWQERLRPGIDSLANLSTVLHMLDTYVKFNRLASRSAAIEELLQATPSDEVQDKLDASFHSNVADDDGEFGETWNVLHGTFEVASSSTQTSESSFKEVEFQNVCCQAVVSTNEATVQTEFLPFTACMPITGIPRPDHDRPIKAAVAAQPNTIKQLAPAIKRFTSPVASRKKSIGSIAESIGAKRPRKAPPIKAKAYINASHSNAVVTSSPTSCGIPACGQTFTAPHVYNNMASSQTTIGNFIASPQSSIGSFSSMPSIPNNVYLIRGQHGIPINMSPISQSRRSFILNPRVVLSPLPIMNCNNDVAAQSEMMRKNLEQIGARTLGQSFYSFPCPLQTMSQQKSPISDETREADLNVSVAACAKSTKSIFSPVSIVREAIDVTCKKEFNGDDAFMISKELPMAYQQTATIRNLQNSCSITENSMLAKPDNEVHSMNNTQSANGPSTHALYSSSNQR